MSTEPCANPNSDLERKKLELEIKMLSAESDRAERISVANLNKAEAEARDAYFNAEIVKLDHEYNLNRHRMSRLSLRRREYPFVQSVDSNSVRTCISMLKDWDIADIVDEVPPSAFTVSFTSPGGSVLDGFALYDELRRFSDNKGHKIITRVAGVAASMAGVLLQAGDERVIGAQSRLHIHEPASLGVGKMSDIGDTHDLLKSMFGQMCEIYARRGNMTAEEIRERAERQEWWMTADEALAHGFADRIG